MISSTPLRYDEQLRCASFELSLHKHIPATTHNLDIDPLFDRFPDLRRHRCLCGKHRSFYGEARQTETVHLLEHLAIELLVQGGIARSEARGETGLPRCGESRNYRLRIYGAQSLRQAEEALTQAATQLQKLLLV